MKLNYGIVIFVMKQLRLKVKSKHIICRSQIHKKDMVLLLKNTTFLTQTLMK